MQFVIADDLNVSAVYRQTLGQSQIEAFAAPVLPSACPCFAKCCRLSGKKCQSVCTDNIFSISRTKKVFSRVDKHC